MTHGKNDSQPLAIIGMACRLPGADNIGQFWDMLRRGGSGIGEIPADRLDRELHYDPRKGRLNKTYSSLGGIVSRRPFDRAVCPLTDEQIASADVAHLTLCEVAATACRQAGLDPFDLPLRNTGVFVGHTAASPLAAQVAYRSSVGQMAHLLAELDPIRSLSAADRDELVAELIAAVRSGAPALGAGGKLELSSLAASKLISRGFGLTGPFLVVDSACASSLQALAIAAANLQQGRIDMAIVGGASYCKSDTLVLFSHAQSLSARGSRPFDAAADGLILAEGYVAVVVKTVARALADGDEIQAVIRGIGMSTDGHGKSLWAPRKTGQVLAIQRAYGRDLDMKRLQYVEAHATSTQIGDATELQALAEALTPALPPGYKIPIGSVKANVGHTLEAAGLTGLVKTVLAMRHQVVPPAVNCERLNPEIDWNRAPFFVPTRELAWPAPAEGAPRRAAVNSFGIGGLNVHIVLDEFAEAAAGHSAPASTGQQKLGSELAQAEAVAIVGVGCLLPGAQTVNALWDLLSSGRDAKSPLPTGRWNPAAAIDHRTGKSFADHPPVGGFIKDYAYDWRRHVVPPKQVEQANPLQFMLLDATEQALADAGYDRKPLDRNRVAVVVGTVFGDEFSQQLNMALRLPEFQRTLAGVLAERGYPASEIEQLARRFEKLLIQRMPALVDETGSFTSSTLASRITKSFDFFGGALALDAGEAGGLAAVATAADFLLNGSCDAAICAAGDRNLGGMIYEAETLSGRLASGEPRSTFNDTGGGSVPGEGVAVLLLKRLSDARRDGDPIRGILRGFGASAGQDLYQASRFAMRRALRDAQIEPKDVAMLEVASAAAGDALTGHVAAIAETYGSSERPTPMQVSSLVGQIGNIKAASGAAGVIKSALVLQHGELPAEFGVDSVAPRLAAMDGKLNVARRSTPLATSGPESSLYAAVTATADDCLAYHVVLQRGSPVNVHTAPAASSGSRAREASPTGRWQIVRIAGESLPDLAAKCAALVPSAASEFAAPSATAFAADSTRRLALVAESPEALADKLRLAAQQLPVPQSRVPLEEQGIFYHQHTQPAKVAFLFPGQGSQYAGMLGDLTAQHPAAGEAMREADAALALLGHPTFAEITSDADQLLGVDLLRTQLSVLLADFILFRTICGLGVQPAIVSGHSYGEFAALLAAGCWTLEQAIGATVARCRAIDLDVPRVATQMVSVAAGADAVRQYLSGQDNVFLSHQNAPDQTVVAGEAQAVQQVAARLRSAGLESRPLAVPRAFHTPLMAGSQASFAAALEKAWIVAPRVALLSSVSRRLVHDPAEIRANLVAQLTAPVEYVELVRQLSAAGANVLVEIGPQQVLTRLHRRIVGEHVVCVGTDHSKRGSEQQMCRVLAQLECAGVKFGDSPVAEPAGRAPSSDPLHTQFVSFDATTRRKAKVRSGPSTDRIAATPPTVDAAPRQPSPPPTVVAGSAIRNGHEHGQGHGPAEWNNHGGGSANGHRKSPAAAELETFLVQFVIDQTGYPPEIVRLDADLEGDLGIDSIKKAQLFVELGEYFDVTPSDDLRLDMFPTLRHVLNFLKDVPGKPGWLDSSDGGRPTPSPVVPRVREEWEYVPAAAAGLLAEASAAVLPATSTSTMFAGQSVATAAVGLDRSQRPQATIRAKANAPRIEEIERFLIDFVVDQTGYPLEIVRLDADLEGDLGIDSIKKAQMFSELGEFYEVSNPENLRLDDFVTLRNVLELLQSSGLEEVAPPTIVTGPVQAPAASPVVPAAPQVIPPAAVAAPADDETTTEEIVDRLHGLAYDAAREFGEKHRLTIRARLKRLAENATKETIATAGVSRLLSDPGRCFAESELEELRGLADGAGVFLGNLLAHHWAIDPRRRGETGAAAPESAAAPAPAKKPGQLTTRLVPRVIEAPLGSVTDLRAFHSVGPAVILGDNALAQALAKRLTSLGTTVEVISSAATWPQVRERFDRAWSRQPIRHVFLATAHDPDARHTAGETDWQRRFGQGVLTPFFLCQEWLTRLEDARLCEGATLVALTALGGEFGFSGDVETLEGGAATGLLKSLFVESRYEKWTGLRFKVLDFSLSEPIEEAAEAVFGELSGNQEDLEVGYRAGHRRVVRVVEQPAPEAPCRDVPSGTWVVTGGGRGIMAITALALARRFGLRLHLIGLAPKPNLPASWLGLSESALQELKQSVFRQSHAAGQAPYESWRQVEKSLEIQRTLDACAAAGVTATYHSCDVSAWDDLRGVLDEIRRADGPIEGILHGAGVVHDAAFRRKKPEHVRQTYAAKNIAAAALIELTKDDPLKHFVAFGSMSGRLGMRGQADYSSANDLLAKQIDRLRQDRPSCRSLAIHWHPWGETGLAARPELQATFASLEIKFMSPAEGVEHLIRELESGFAESEVLFTDAETCRKQYPLPCIVSPDELQPAVAPRAADRAPLLDEIFERSAGQKLAAEMRLHPTDDCFLSEHLLGGQPLLPFVIGIEAVAQAAAMVCGEPPLVIENVEVHRSVSFSEGRPQSLRVEGQRAADGKFDVRLTNEFRDRGGQLVDPARLCFSARVACGKGTMPRLEPPGQPPLGWFPMAYPDDAPIYHGPKFRCLTDLAIQYDGAFGQIVVPAAELLAPSRPKSAWVLPAAALDACLMLCSTFAYLQFGKRFEIPLALGRLEIGRRPAVGEVCIARMFYKGQDARSARYDFGLFGADGDCLLSAVGYQTTVISSGRVGLPKVADS